MWTLQDAKNRFSAVVDAALAGQPQQVTRRGKPAVVVLAADDYDRMLNAARREREGFVAHLVAFPACGEPQGANDKGFWFGHRQVAARAAAALIEGEPMRRLLASALLLSLAACADSTGVPMTGAIDQAPSAEHLALAHAAGLNPPSAITSAAKAEGGAARDVALAGAAAVNPVGMSNVAGFGLGVLSVLAAPPEGPEVWDTTLVKLPTGSSPDRFAADMQVAVEKMTGAWARPGYTRITSPRGQTLYASCAGAAGALPPIRCLQGIEVVLTPMGKMGGSTVYVMRLEQYGSARLFSPSPLNNVDQHKALSRAFPGRVYTYLAPRRMAKGWTPAAIYDAGRTYPL